MSPRNPLTRYPPDLFLWRVRFFVECSTMEAENSQSPVASCRKSCRNFYCVFCAQPGRPYNLLWRRAFKRNPKWSEARDGELFARFVSCNGEKFLWRNDVGFIHFQKSSCIGVACCQSELPIWPFSTSPLTRVGVLRLVWQAGGPWVCRRAAIACRTTVAERIEALSKQCLGAALEKSSSQIARLNFHL